MKRDEQNFCGQHRLDFICADFFVCYILNGVHASTLSDQMSQTVHWRASRVNPFRMM
jgi:hypothetical protein